jgi:excisionase family DNA binding protein
MRYHKLMISFPRKVRNIMTNEPEKWTSIEDIAGHLKVHKDTVRNWIRSSEIPVHKVGRQYRFRISEVDEWVVSGKSANIAD